jgi:hypothetical protein
MPNVVQHGMLSAQSQTLSGNTQETHSRSTNSETPNLNRRCEMEAIKFLMFYAIEVVVVGLLGLTLLAGVYQLVRDKARSRLFTARRPAMAKR